MNANTPLSDGSTEGRSNLLASTLSLFASSSTLVCCALPALLVALGAGAALSSLVSVFPQLVWLSEHKTGLFVMAGTMLVASGALQWRNRNAPCPIDPKKSDACMRARRASMWMLGFSGAVYLVGAWFAFGAPWLAELNT